MANGDLKDLPRRTASDKAFPDKIFSIAESLEYHWISKGCCFNGL